MGPSKMVASVTSGRKFNTFRGFSSTRYFFLLFLLLHDIGPVMMFWKEYIEMRALQELREYNKQLIQHCKTIQLADWAYETNITEENGKAAVNARQQFYDYKKNQWLLFFSQVDYSMFSSENLKRKFKSLDENGIMLYIGDYYEKISEELTATVMKMTTIYSTAKYPTFKKNLCHSVEKRNTQDECHSQVYDQFLHRWKAWRNSTGRPIRSLYENYVYLSNKVAQHHGYSDKGQMWRSNYDSDDLKDQVLRLWDTIEPLYIEIHKFIRRRMKEYYGDRLDISDGLLPDHLMTNLEGDRFEVVKPFPEAVMTNITKSLVEQGFDVLQMFKLADDFYVSMGLANNSVSYGKKSMLVQPTDREVVCHPSAWQFCDGEDYRIKMCTEIDMENFYVILHEMGHVQYFLQYNHQPFGYQQSPNPGFHEAIGNTIIVSAHTPSYLKEVGLLTNYEDTYENTINFLMEMAVQQILILPRMLVVEFWRWDVFSGNISHKNWNKHWWNLKMKYEHLKPPVPRTESDFDAGSSHHVAADSENINYFIATILQFQFHKALCSVSNNDTPTDIFLFFQKKRSDLHKCSIYRSKAAGELLRRGMELGCSVHWSDVLEAITGERTYSSSPLLEYFFPLYQFLLLENLKAEKEEEEKSFLNVLQSFGLIVGITLGLLCYLLYVCISKCCCKCWSVCSAANTSV